MEKKNKYLEEIGRTNIKKIVAEAIETNDRLNKEIMQDKLVPIGSYEIRVNSLPLASDKLKSAARELDNLIEERRILTEEIDRKITNSKRVFRNMVVINHNASERIAAKLNQI